MKAIETRYKGYRFRSRLEARWAVFFDALELDWEYEPEGFELDVGTRYLPDFWLLKFCGKRGLYVEVKPDEGDFSKALLFSRLSGNLLLLACGMPDAKIYPLCHAGEMTDCIFDESYLSKGNEYRLFMGCSGVEPELVDISHAVNAARGARFEFGEQG